ncbi:response regulator [Leptolyngbya sp. 15MV]|nr:response regulator [Leptolyngbya sp. 15MV]
MGSSPTVLLADDEPLITSVVAQKLRSAGFQVLVAHDGEEALEVASRTPPDVVVTDLQMPRLSGLELAIRLKAMPSTTNVPVIMLTARGYIVGQSELGSTNIRYLMSKPFSPREVLAKVNAVLGRGEEGLRVA